jgi:acyl carrier protein
MFEDKILELSKIYGKPKTDITMNSSFKEDLRMDSLSLVEFVVACEDEFDIEIDLDSDRNSEIETLKDLHDAIVWIKNN